MAATNYPQRTPGNTRKPGWAGFVISAVIIAAISLGAIVFSIAQS